MPNPRRDALLSYTRLDEVALGGDDLVSMMRLAQAQKATQLVI
jgi:hypothetical protein